MALQAVHSQRRPSRSRNPNHGKFFVGRKLMLKLCVSMVKEFPFHQNNPSGSSPGVT
jgi:hypothetical protein